MSCVSATSIFRFLLFTDLKRMSYVFSYVINLSVDGERVKQMSAQGCLQVALDFSVRFGRVCGSIVKLCPALMTTLTVACQALFS